MEVWLEYIITGILDNLFVLCNVTKSSLCLSFNFSCATESPDQGWGHKTDPSAMSLMDHKGMTEYSPTLFIQSFLFCGSLILLENILLSFLL